MAVASVLQFDVEKEAGACPEGFVQPMGLLEKMPLHSDESVQCQNHKPVDTRLRRLLGVGNRKRRQPMSGQHYGFIS